MFSSRRRSFSHLFIVVLAAFVFCSVAYAEFPEFEYHLIDKVGSRMGQTSLVDVDKDGDLDWIAGCNGGTIWWFEYKGPDSWVRHLLGQKTPTDVGGTAFDVDGDGWVDQVSGAAWYRNTAKPREQEFIKYPNAVIERSHDIVSADIDGDGKIDILAMSDRSGLFWYKIPADPTRTWIEHRIGGPVHGGSTQRAQPTSMAMVMSTWFAQISGSRISMEKGLNGQSTKTSTSASRRPGFH